MRRPTTGPTQRAGRHGVRSADQARDLRDQGEPHLRPGLRRPAEGNGDPELCLFGDDVTPNHHELAREFVLLDNFYFNGECRRRPPWSTQATPPTTWKRLAVRLRLGLLPKLQQRVRAARPAVPERAAGLRSQRSALGLDGHRGRAMGRRLRSQRQLPRLRRGHALGRPDNCTSGANASDLTRLRRGSASTSTPGSRAGTWTARTTRCASRSGSASSMATSGTTTCPGLEIVYFPNDHTQGTRPSGNAPSYMADNDLALGSGGHGVAQQVLVEHGHLRARG